MIIRARAPLRLGLAGGGTDVSPYTEQFGGSVMNVTIEKHAWCTIETLDHPAVIIESHDLDQHFTYDLMPVLPTDGRLDLTKAVYNRVVRDFNKGEPLALRVGTLAEAPPGSGLGSSSTLCVAVLQAFVELLSLPLGEYDVAHLAWEIERQDLGLHGGRQDQYAATFGGFNFMEFKLDGNVIVNPLKIKDRVVNELEAQTLLCFTGVSRESARIIDEQSANVIAGSTSSIEATHRLKLSATTMKEALLRGRLDLVAENLRDGWASKRAMAAGISNALIEQMQEAALAAGAHAGKISGAGGGGFIMFLVAPERRRAVARAMESFGGITETCRFTYEGATAWRVS